MRIQCDVCSKEEASVFCTADEAALCDGCDRRVHHANKLASKHHRFSLLHPSPSSSSPLCDICQEKRAFLFCQQDRAILCRECDVPIHTANELTLKHHRFLLTGVKLSSTPSLYSAANTTKSHQPPPAPASKTNTTTTTSSSDHHQYSNNDINIGNNNTNDSQETVLVPSSNCSTISEYLMEMLPGWHVEDLLEATTPSSTPFGFPKVDAGLLSFGQTNREADSNISNNSVSLSASASERLGIWVPQAPPAAANFLHPQLLGFNHYNNKETAGATNYSKEATSNYSLRANKRLTTEDLFAVPQISPPSGVGSKRSKPFY